MAKFVQWIALYIFELLGYDVLLSIRTNNMFESPIVDPLEYSQGRETILLNATDRCSDARVSKLVRGMGPFLGRHHRLICMDV